MNRLRLNGNLTSVLAFILFVVFLVVPVGAFAGNDNKKSATADDLKVVTGVVVDKKTGEYKFTHGTHNIWDVPVFVSATDAGFTSGKEIANRDIPTQIARVMGYGREQFPATIASLK